MESECAASRLAKGAFYIYLSASHLPILNGLDTVGWHDLLIYSSPVDLYFVNMIAKSGFELSFSKPSANLEIGVQKHPSLSDFVRNLKCEYQDIQAAIVSKRIFARPKHCLSPASVGTRLVRDALRNLSQGQRMCEYLKTYAPRYCFGASHRLHGLDPA